MSANDSQIGGNHYKGQAVQPWDFIVSNGLGYLEGNVVKYVSRWRKKGGVEDLRKAQHYLAKLIEVAESERPQGIGNASVVGDLGPELAFAERGPGIVTLRPPPPPQTDPKGAA